MQDEDQMWCDVSGIGGAIARYAGGLWLMGAEERQHRQHIREWLMQEVERMCAELGGRFVPNAQEAEPEAPVEE